MKKLKIPFPLEMTRAGAECFPISRIKEFPIINSWDGIFDIMEISLDDRENLQLEAEYNSKINVIGILLGTPELLFFWKGDSPLTRLDYWRTKKYEFRDNIAQEKMRKRGKKILFEVCTVEIVHLKERNVGNEK